MDELILASVDDHVVEPPNMFEAHIPARCRDRVPKVITKADSSDAWVLRDRSHQRRSQRGGRSTARRVWYRANSLH